MTTQTHFLRKWDDPTIREPNRYIRQLKDFEFIFMLSIFSELFSKTSILFKFLEKKANDIDFCANCVSEFLYFLKEAMIQHMRIIIRKLLIKLETSFLLSRECALKQKVQKQFPKHISISYILVSLTTKMEVRFEDLKKL